MKKLLVIVLSIAILVLGFNTCFASVDEDALEVVKVLGIMNGDEHGNLNLSSKVTRAEFVKMLICASVYKDKVPEISYYSPYSDVPYTHWASGYVQLAVDQGWVNGYTDGTFRPDNTINLEEAVTLIISILGYTSADMIGTFPYGQLALYNSLSLNKNVTARQGTQLSRQDCVYLFYNMLGAETKGGQKYLQMLGYSADANGNVDIYKIINENVDGPFVVTTNIDELGFNIDNIIVERNGASASLDDVSRYDIVYYSDKLNKIWVYSNAITGTYEGATPSTLSPSSVKINGITYSLETSQATYALSSNGKYKVGDVVTALIGREGIVRVMSPNDYTLSFYGVVTGLSTQTYLNSKGTEYTAKCVNIYGTDGNKYTIKNNNQYKEFDIGQIVEVSYANGNPTITRLSKQGLSGKVSTEKIGDFKIANNVNILDVHRGSVKKIYMSRLSGAILSKSDVLFYNTNASGEITDLILDNFTGDLYKYVLFTNIDESSDGGYYTYIMGLEESTISTGAIFGVKKGFGYIDSDGSDVRNIGKLKELGKVTKISTNTISSYNSTMYIADDVMVYYKDGSDYLLISVSELVNNFEDYNITAYYDDSVEYGGRVRAILAI